MSPTFPGGAGSLATVTLIPGWSSALKAQAERDIPGRVEFAGVSADPRSDFLEADLFVLPSRYEGYGMAFAEGIACGLPVVGCPVGALPEICLPEAGRLVPVGDAAALAGVLRELLSDPDGRQVMAAAAFAAGQKLPRLAAHRAPNLGRAGRPGPMSGFDPGWLDLRIAADDAARDSGLFRAAVEYARGVPSPLIVDLGTGTGANARFMAEALRNARWRLVDGDAALLAIAERRCSGLSADLRLQDLASPEELPIAEARLVTASALLDLVSANWVDRLVGEIAAANAGFYAALSFDGRMIWRPAFPSDGAIAAAFARHQRGDKGFGPALGAEAVAYAQVRFEASGYQVRVAPSPWKLGPREADLARELVHGIVAAVAETGRVAAASLDAWKAFRLSQLASGTCEIGHYDLLATPPAIDQ